MAANDDLFLLMGMKKFSILDSEEEVDLIEDSEVGAPIDCQPSSFTRNEAALERARTSTSPLPVLPTCALSTQEPLVHVVVEPSPTGEIEVRFEVAS